MEPPGDELTAPLVNFEDVKIGASFWVSFDFLFLLCYIFRFFNLITLTDTLQLTSQGIQTINITIIPTVNPS